MIKVLKNQKWDKFKIELQEGIKEDRELSRTHRIQQFYEFVEPYVEQEIQYGSSVYYRISKKLSELNLREDKSQTLYWVLKSNNIPYEYINGNIVIKKETI